MDAAEITPLLKKPPALFSPGHRMRMNIMPIFLNIFIPWAIFVYCFSLASFYLMYSKPVVAWVCISAVFAVWLLFVLVAFCARKYNPDPTWFTFFTILAAICAAWGIIAGLSNLENYEKPYYTLKEMRDTAGENSTGVNPTTVSGEDVMDAGIITFAAGSVFDASKTWHFMKGTLYCVAPIVGPNAAVPLRQTYDFWAVGKDCCSISASDFRCGSWGSTTVERWQAFGRVDQLRLEEAHRAFDGCEPETEMETEFTETGEARRSAWFRVCRGLEPYGPASNARLAEAAARLQPGAQEEVVLGMRRVRMYMNWGKIQAEEDSEQGMSSWLGFSRVAVQQGVGNLPAEEEEELQQEVGQIVVVVHGIGEMLNQRWGAGMVQDLGVLRRTLQQQQLQVAREAPKTEVLGCEWWQSIHSEEMDKRLASITLPSLAAVRDFANLSLVDGLAFTQERERIITTTAANLETAVSRFKDCHPNFRGQIFLLGHSLGGVILWDILTQQRLAFTPNALFTVGSPIGVFLHAAGALLQHLPSLGPGGLPCGASAGTPPGTAATCLDGCGHDGAPGLAAALQPARFCH
ncbi:unnamed protein product [Effrenium voratum]|uniref:Uncharacterized protein n=1 Tax=Effrenium voratum TaxID=2562239 RepID=A0AA36ICA6_9DINO|nr:unnamed protein product [Effrenium voratum]